MPLVGRSTAGGGDHDAAPIASSAPASAAIPADFRASFTKANHARFMSRGHLDDRFAVDVYVNATAAQAWRSESATIPPGAMLVKEQFDRTVSGDRPAGVVAMEKREAGFDPDNGDWRWIAVDAKGAIVKDGKIDRCSACHRESKHDFVFSVE
jgi:Cytochrome P460